MGKSAVGPGIKAGGPNYVAQLMQFQETEHPPGSQSPSDPHLVELAGSLQPSSPERIAVEERDRVLAAIRSCDRYFHEEFARQHDHFLLLGQDNFRRYLPLRDVRIRVAPPDSAFDLLARVAAAKTAGVRITVSIPPGLKDHVPIRSLVDWLDQTTESWAAAIEFVEESDEELADVIRQGRTERIRYAAADRVPQGIRAAAAETGFYLADAPVRMNGRVELLWYLQEQSLSVNYHRYGNLGDRAEEPRTEPL
jgi:RHH-type proline utilization regulon transcriptional repressor/proline dehydrogenase/delta 1-pyrroline-5-carboxylate dehydrogenase